MSEEQPCASSQHPPRRVSWLSKGLEAIEKELDPNRDVHFDVVIVGSGYGAAIAAAELAGCRDKHTQQPLSVCVLERGREYLDGAFVRRMAELPGHVRFSTPGRSRPGGVRTGLFDFRLAPDVCALVANGLGGGSLINAGVMVRPDEATWRDPAWPEAIQENDMARWLDQAERMLGARLTDGSPNRWSDATLPKHAALKRVAGKAPFEAPALTTALENRPTTQGGVARTACNRCGDCATGCNWGAKESLDTNLLVRAWRQGAQLYSGATVTRVLRRPANGRPAWEVEVRHTDDKLHLRQSKGFTVRARRVVLCAGTYGSTEILLRSRSTRRGELTLSPRLGSGFSANGDLIAALADLAAPAHGVGDEARAPAERNVGPTITAMIDDRQADDPMIVQEMAVPLALRPLLQEATALAGLFERLAEADQHAHAADDGDPLAVDDGDTDRTLVVAVMGRDGADGTLRLIDPTKRTDAFHGDGAVTVHWPHARDDPRLEQRLRRLADRLQLADPGARLLSNPLWRLLPSQLEFVFGHARGPLVTVHPLGGCPMGPDPYQGVVDADGRVYVGPAQVDERDTQERKPLDAADVHEGLAVLDGSILPASLGINPALTIAALALRAVRRLRTHWEILEPESPDDLAGAAPAGEGVAVGTTAGAEAASAAVPPAGASPAGEPRPAFRRDDPTRPPPTRRPTAVQLIERLHGPVSLEGEPYHAELTLHFKPQSIEALIGRSRAQRVLHVEPALSRLRLFTRPVWRRLQRLPHQERPDSQACWIAPVSRGTLHLFGREPSTAPERRQRALWPWLRNRGIRDIWHAAEDAVLDAWHGHPPADPRTRSLAQQLPQYAQSVWRLLSRAGEARRLEYDLTFEPAQGQAVPAALAGPSRLLGIKRLTYARRSNPWRQLSRVHVAEAPFGGVDGQAARLELDLHFLTRGQLPILRVVGQQDQPSALVDLARLAVYVLRVVIQVHAWSFRLPDAAEARPTQRLPGELRLGRFTRVPAQVREIAVDRLDGVGGAPVLMRLTRYAQRRPAQAVLLIHGYSLSGTMFAHPAIRRDLASYLWRHGRDVWVLDLRSSQGMPTAREPWTFEQIANADIPLAVDHVFRATGGKIEVVAHCMGSAMLCMGLLGEAPGVQAHERDEADPFWPLREQMPKRIAKLVMSQITPRMLFSSANLFRAFVMRYLRHYLDAETYSFRVEGRRGIRDQLLDRLLATLPYPESEFDLENPLLRRTPWVGTRHRMDALYGRSFALANLAPETLRHLDDQFGPMSMETVSQVMHFARRFALTDSQGRARFLTASQVRAGLPFPMLSLHGEDNGLADPATRHLMEDYFGLIDTGVDYRSEPIAGYGHQDCLIGRNAERDVFPKILDFLNKG